MESVAENAEGDAFAQVLGKCQEHRASVDNPAVALLSNREGITAALFRIFYGRFQFNCRLGFIVDVIANSGHGRDGVKQPASA